MRGMMEEEAMSESGGGIFLLSRKRHACFSFSGDPLHCLLTICS